MVSQIPKVFYLIFTSFGQCLRFFVSVWLSEKIKKKKKKKNRRKMLVNSTCCAKPALPQPSASCFLFLLLSFSYSLLIFFFFLFLVAAINALFISLGYPPLRGWILVGGDPCGEKWQGVECVFSNITSLYVNSIHHFLANFSFLSVNNVTIVWFCHRQLSGLNLGGELGTSLDQFESIISMQVSTSL